MNALVKIENIWGTSIDNPHKIENFSQLSKFIIKNIDIKPSDSIEDIQNKYKCIIEDYTKIYNDINC